MKATMNDEEIRENQLNLHTKRVVTTLLSHAYVHTCLGS